MDDKLQRNWTILVALFICGFLLSPQMHSKNHSNKEASHQDHHAHHMHVSEPIGETTI